MSNTTQSTNNHAIEKLQAVIERAKQKLNTQNVNDLCRYLPSEDGGYIHHFTLAKQSKEQPEKVEQLIQQYVLDTQMPKQVPGKSRGPRKARSNILPPVF